MVAKLLAFLGLQKKAVAVVHPKFCSVCGQELVETVEVLRYDAFTGQPLQTRHTLRCSVDAAHDMHKWVE